MAFDPRVNQEIVIDGVSYRFAEHPAAPSMPFGQSGRAATVYKLESQAGPQAFKVFFDRFRSPSLVALTDRLARFAVIPGLSVCRRSVLTPQRHADLLRPAPDLVYAVRMPWIEGPTWLQILQDKQPLTREQSLLLARELAVLLSNMEQQGLAHCDLSNANVLFPALAKSRGAKAQAPVELVDVEQMYAASLDRPTLIPSGSEGYAHRTIRTGAWEEKADRFAGAILLAEILGWAVPSVRDAAHGESFFDPNELQLPSARFSVLKSAMVSCWGNELARLLDRAWNSDLLADCPTFGEWMLAIPDQRAQSSINLSDVSIQKNNRPTELRDPSYGVVLSLADQLLAQNNFQGALESYRRALRLTASSEDQEQIQIKILHAEQRLKQPAANKPREMGPDTVAELDRPNMPEKKRATVPTLPVYAYGIAGVVVVALVIGLTMLVGQKKSAAQAPIPSMTVESTAAPRSTETLAATHTAVPTGTAAPTATPVPTSTSTPEPMPVPESKVLYQQNFEKGTLAGWDNRSSTPIKIVEENGNRYMHYVATGMSYPGIWKADNVKDWKNYAFESRVRLKTDGVFLCFRVYGKAGAFYNVFLDPNASTVVFADYDPGRSENYQTFGSKGYTFDTEWHLVRVEARGDELKVYIDNQLVTSTTRASLNYGGVAYYTGENGEFDVDDIRIWSLDN